MGVEDIRRWQWVVVGLVLGVSMSYAWRGLEGPAVRKISQQDFERELIRRPAEGDVPRIRNLVVFPPQESFETYTEDGVQKRRLVQRVKGQRLLPDARAREGEAAKPVYQPFEFVAPMPYKPQRGGPPNPPDDFTVLGWLEHMRRNREFSYRYAWEQTPRWNLALFAGGGVLLFGGLLPTLINVLTGAGFGRPRRPADEPPEKKVDLRKVRSTSTSEPEPARPAVTDEDRARLDEVNATLEKDLAGAQITGDGATGAAPASVIRPLETRPLEPLVETKHDDEPKEYRGEYYPVAKPTHKADDPPGAHHEPQGDAPAAPSGSAAPPPSPPR